jgi:hypothetical protein
MPDLIRHPVPAWIPAFAGMTTLRYLVAGVIKRGEDEDHILNIARLGPMLTVDLILLRIHQQENFLPKPL